MKNSFKLEVSGGRYNGAERYYKSLASAVRAARAFSRADEKAFEDSYFEIFQIVIYPSFVLKRLVQVIG